LIYRPPRGLGLFIGLVLTGWALAGALLLAVEAALQGVEFEGFLAALFALFFTALALVFAYWTLACLSTAYIVDRNGLAIQWGPIRQLIPLDRIQRLVPGANVKKPRIRGLGWWGHHVGQGTIRGIGHTLFYSTHRSRTELLYVVTAEQSYGICVHEQVLFAREIENRRAMGPIQAVPQAPVRNALAGQAFWLDRTVQLLLVAGLALCAAIYGYIFWEYPGLDETIDLSFPSLGGVVRVGDKSELLKIPNAALVILMIDVVLALAFHFWQRLLAYIILLGGIFTQAVLLVAAYIALN
jgi:Bacterial PH domain